MNRLDEILTLKALAFKHAHENTQLVDYLLEKSPESYQNITKNVCAHLPIPLVERLENTLSLLDMSKREFITAALLDALDRFDKIAVDHDIYQGLPELDDSRYEEFNDDSINDEAA